MERLVVLWIRRNVDCEPVCSSPSCLRWPRSEASPLVSVRVLSSAASNWVELDFLIRTQWLAEGEACDRRAVAQLRGQRWTGKQIAAETGISPAPQLA